MIRRSGLVAVLAASLVAVSPVPPALAATSAAPLPQDRLHFGVSSQPSDLTWMTSSGVPWKYRYQYLSAGVNTGNGWETWNSPTGAFATYYMNVSEAHGYIPVFSYYELLQSNPSTGSNESDRDFSNLNNASTMNAYYANFKLLMQLAGDYGKQVIVHVEPDLWGYLQQRAAGGAASSLTASVASSGFADLAGLPNTVQGFAWALLELRDTYGPNAVLAIHASMWASGIDIATTTDATTNPVTIADSTATFLGSAGLASNPYGTTWDAVFNDVDDHDAGWWEKQGALNRYFTHWWDPTNMRAPNFSRYLAWVAELHTRTARPQVAWQVPAGNQYFLTMNNTCGHYQDNVAPYFLAHTDDLFNAGLVAVLFGAGNQCQTTNTDGSPDGTGDGVTNNGGVATTDTLGGCTACNTHTSTYADDDGGYLRIFVGRYYLSSSWSASYSMTPPAAWVVGQTRSVSVTVTNTGNQAWPAGGANPVRLDVHFTPVPGGASHISLWKTSQIYNLSSDVPPGASATLNINVTAPTSAGAMYLEAEMFKDHQFWFAQAQAAPVSVYNHWQASFDISAAPTGWAANQTRSFAVSLTNVGDQTWTSSGANPVMLNINFSTTRGGSNDIYCCWKSSRSFGLGGDVAPGGSTTVTVTVTAPSAAGSYYLEAQLFKNQQFWFPNWTYKGVTVAAAVWSTSYAMTAPATWTAGQTQSVSVTLTNTGNQTWPSGGANPVKLDLNFSTTHGGNHDITCCWKTSQTFSLGGDVAPGASVTLTVSVTAPAVAGSYYLEAQLFKNQQFWFGTWTYTPVTVS